MRAVLLSIYRSSKYIAILSVIFLALLVVFYFDPAVFNIYPPCLFHSLTGLACPGCGFLRATHQILRGRFFNAFKLNPLIVILMPVILYNLIYSLTFSISNKALPVFFKKAFWSWFLLAIIIAFWILRNIPVYPFYLLLP
ncbi:MAG: DUF2752 domain-containing protein [Elusimicrobiota bacterium]